MEGEPTDITRRIDRHGWRLDALDDWRKDADRRLAIMESEVLTVREGRILEETLRRQHTDRQKIRLTWWQHAGAIIVVVTAILELVKGLHG